MRRLDPIHNPLPWVVLATAYAFESGNHEQRVKAREYVAGALASPLGIENDASEGGPWIVTEMLFAIRESVGLQSRHWGMVPGTDLFD